MGSKEESVQGKTATPVVVVPNSQEVPTTASMYSTDWQSMTAYYGGAAAAGAPPAFFSPPSPSPYMWGGQHLMHPYGTPLPYHAIYPPGMYTFPPMTQGVMIPAAEFEGRPERKDCNLTKNSEVGFVSVNQTAGKPINGVREKCTSTNDDVSPSGGSGSENSSNTGDQIQNQQDISATGKRSENMNPDVLVPGNITETAPVTNLNIGMDIWNGSDTGSLRRKEKLSPVTMAPPISPIIGQNGVITGNHWDERELKRQKRKESNRESARRSRQRKQQECEELSKKVEELTTENTHLRNEIDQIKQQCKALESDNILMRKEFGRLGAPESPSAVDGNNNKFTSHPIQSTVK